MYVSIVDTHECLGFLLSEGNKMAGRNGSAVDLYGIDQTPMANTTLSTITDLIQ